MKQAQNNKSQIKSLWMSALLGAVIALLISLIGSVLVTFLIDAGNVSENAYSPTSIVLWFLSAMIGTLVACKKASQQYLIVSGLTVIGYLFVLIAIQIMFFDSQFDHIWKGILISAAGIVPSILMCGRSGNRRKAKFKYRPV